MKKQKHFKIYFWIQTPVGFMHWFSSLVWAWKQCFIISWFQSRKHSGNFYTMYYVHVNMSTNKKNIGRNCEELLPKAVLMVTVVYLGAFTFCRHYLMLPGQYSSIWKCSSGWYGARPSSRRDIPCIEIDESKKRKVTSPNSSMKCCNPGVWHN